MGCCAAGADEAGRGVEALVAPGVGVPRREFLRWRATMAKSPAPRMTMSAEAQSGRPAGAAVPGCVAAMRAGSIGMGRESIGMDRRCG